MTILSYQNSYYGSRDLPYGKHFLRYQQTPTTDKSHVIPEFHGKIAIGNPANREKELNHASQCDASYSKKLLDIDWIPFNKTVEDFANQWYEQHK